MGMKTQASQVKRASNKSESLALPLGRLSAAQRSSRTNLKSWRSATLMPRSSMSQLPVKRIGEKNLPTSQSFQCLKIQRHKRKKNRTWRNSLPRWWGLSRHSSLKTPNSPRRHRSSTKIRRSTQTLHHLSIRPNLLNATRLTQIIWVTSHRAEWRTISGTRGISLRARAFMMILSWILTRILATLMVRAKTKQRRYNLERTLRAKNSSRRQRQIGLRESRPWESQW